MAHEEGWVSIEDETALMMTIELERREKWRSIDLRLS